MKRLLTVMALMLAAMPLRAQLWRPTAGPEGAEIRALAASGRTLLALCAPGALYRRDGESWVRLGELDAQNLYAIGETFIATSYRGIYRSTDRGDNWTRGELTGSEHLIALDGATLYAAVDDTIYRSTDEGGTWKLHAAPGMNFFSFFARDSVMLVGRGEGEGLYRSGDGGRSWSHVDSGLPAGAAPEAFHQAGSTIYLSLGSQGIYRSIDRGSSWIAMNEGFPQKPGAIPVISSFLSVGDVLWGAGPAGAYAVINGRWYLKARATGVLLALQDGVLYRGTNSGMNRSVDGGQGWTMINEGLRAHRVTALASDGVSIYANATGAIQRTTDNGLSWSRSTPIDAERFAVGGEMIYALGRGLTTPGIFRSLGGESWELAVTGLPHPTTFLSALTAHGDTLFTGYRRAGWDSAVFWRYGGIYRSTDRGTSWSAANTGLPNDGHGDVLVIDILALGRTVLAMTADGLYRSANGGESWEKVDVDLSGENNYGLLARAGDAVYIAGVNQVHGSTDDGKSWTRTGDGIPRNVLIHHLLAVHGDLYAVASDGAHPGRVYKLTGDRWSDITSRFPEHILFETFIEAGEGVLAGTRWNSVWKGGFNPPSGVEEDRVDNGIAIAAAPNPFGAAATVSLRLDRREEVRLTLVSPLGQEIATVFEGTLDAGLRRISLDGSRLGAGVYHVRLAAGDRIRSTVLVKVR